MTITGRILDGRDDVLPICNLLAGTIRCFRGLYEAHLGNFRENEKEENAKEERGAAEG